MKIETAQHTPPPWKLEETQLAIMIRDELNDKELALIAPSLKDSPEEAETHRANAAFIVRAVNAHEELIGLLHESANLIAMLKSAGANYPLVKRIQKAIAKAEARS